jgi:outer membrane protein assembly factor BamB
MVSLLGTTGWAEIRTWTATNGKTMQAEYVGVKDGKVLLIANGREGRIPLERFIAADQAWVRQQGAVVQKNGAAASWPHFRGAQGDGVSADRGLVQRFDGDGPPLLWMSEGFGRGYASVSIANDVIYTTGNTGGGQAVIAANASDGKIIWSQKLTDRDPEHGSDGSRCTPTIDGDRLYVITSDGQIAAVSRADGSVVWQHNFKDWGGRMMSSWGFSESPLVDGDLVICNPGGADAVLVALDKNTGRVRWKCDEDAEGGKGNSGAGYSCAVISNAGGVKQYVTLTGKGVIGVRASDGRFLWGYNRVANGTANIPMPIVIGDHIFCSSGYGDGGSALLKLSRRGSGIQAEELWWKDANELQNHHGGMVRLGDHVYMGHKHNSGYPTCIKWASGNIVWGGKDNRGPGKGSAAIVAADGHLIFRYEDGLVALIEAKPDGYNLKGSFTPAFQRDRSWAAPVVVGGRLYLREQDRIMCYNMRP